MQPIFLEEYFTPGFIKKAAIHVGSQTNHFCRNNERIQSVEGVFLAASSDEDICVVRNVDPFYLSYWHSLVGKSPLINLHDVNRATYLSEVILQDKKIIHAIKKHISPKNSRLMVFSPTSLEQKLANSLDIPLHGSPKISRRYGTKTGVRQLAKKEGISMSEGYICTTIKEVATAIKQLSSRFEHVIVKHDLSFSGAFSKKIATATKENLSAQLDRMMYRKVIDHQDVFVVEGWIKNNASLCAHIEILEGKDPIICAGWQQELSDGGIAYNGASPLRLSKKALASFLSQITLVAKALKRLEAVGSFGPDFIIASEDEKNVTPDTCILIELNARVPFTAFPLEIIKRVKGTIGTGFFMKQITLSSKINCSELLERLKNKKLLITQKDSLASGVVPFNMGLLPWNKCNLAIMSNSWEETQFLIKKIDTLFHG